MIRDKVGKASASLDQFLGHVSPETGIIRVSDYLKTMGWKSIMPSMAQSPCNTYRHQKVFREDKRTAGNNVPSLSPGSTAAKRGLVQLLSEGGNKQLLIDIGTRSAFVCQVETSSLLRPRTISFVCLLTRATSHSAPPWGSLHQHQSSPSPTTKKNAIHAPDRSFLHGKTISVLGSSLPITPTGYN
jgi:hypothetical protein